MPTITAADFTDAADIIDAITTPDEMIETVLLETLRRLTRHDGQLIAWAALRKHLPGNPSRHGEALIRLWQDHRLDLILIDGINYVIANDHLDQLIAERELARHPRRPRTLMVLHS
ncbi:MAG: hypothetical protein ACKOI2_03775 [Actinomycetota bacterium]